MEEEEEDWLCRVAEEIGDDDNDDDNDDDDDDEEEDKSLMRINRRVRLMLLQEEPFNMHNLSRGPIYKGPLFTTEQLLLSYMTLSQPPRHMGR